MRRSRLRVLLLSLVLIASAPAVAPGGGAPDVPDLVARITASYDQVRDYRMRVRSVVQEGDAPPEETLALYWFQRPDRLRMEFLQPHPGLVLVFPYRDGRVRVRPGGLLRFLKISLDPGSASLQVSPGQRVDQTGLGLLVANVARSLTGARPGSLELSQTADHLVAAVEAENHFQPGVATRYRFWVDRELWLPTRVGEEVPSRRWAREVSFEDLEVNPGLPESLFTLE